MYWQAVASTSTWLHLVLPSFGPFAKMELLKILIDIQKNIIVFPNLNINENDILLNLMICYQFSLIASSAEMLNSSQESIYKDSHIANTNF